MENRSFLKILSCVWPRILQKARIEFIAEENDQVPNYKLYHMNERAEVTECHLLDFAKPGRPLVLNFGSCT